MQTSPAVSLKEPDDPQGSAPSGRAIDLVHLAQQSLGDKDLEIELLGLFDRQADTIMDRLAQPCGNGDRRWQMDLAHTLKGSARAVGAIRVAYAAQAHEDVLTGGAGAQDIGASVERLDAAVREAQAVIRDLISGA